MPRPTKPLIERERVVEVGLDVIAREGVEALSIRRIAAELDVNAASLYYHFKDKDEILRAVAGRFMKGVRYPELDQRHWQDWIVAAAMAYHDHIDSAPQFIPLIASGHLTRSTLPMHHTVATLLDRAKVPKPVQVGLLESLEALVVGATMTSYLNAGSGLHFDKADAARRHTVIEQSARILVEGHLARADPPATARRARVKR